MGTPAGDSFPKDDRDPDTVRVDLLVDQVNALLSKMDAVLESRGNNTQTVIHKTAGIGAWGAAAVTACFCTLFGLIFLAYDFGERAASITSDMHERTKTIGDDVRDLKAWQQIHEKRLNQLEHKP